MLLSFRFFIKYYLIKIIVIKDLFQYFQEVMNNTRNSNFIASYFKKKIMQSKAIQLNNFLNEYFSAFPIIKNVTKFQLFMDAIKVIDE